MFLKQKRDGKIKGRTVAGGNKQCDYISKEDWKSLPNFFETFTQGSARSARKRAKQQPPPR
jgi:hypothetical protein